MQTTDSRTSPSSAGPATKAELTALVSMLDELAARTTALAETAQCAGQEGLSAGLFAVERDLKSALRRLTRTATSNL